MEVHGEDQEKLKEFYKEKPIYDLKSKFKKKLRDSIYAQLISFIFN